MARVPLGEYFFHRIINGTIVIFKILLTSLGKLSAIQKWNYLNNSV